MTLLARRTFLGFACVAGLTPATAAPCSPLVSRHCKRRIEQSALEEAIDLHSRWLDGDAQGVRAAFVNCDLSGLDFRSNAMGVVDLRGSDFTEADLSGITGNEVSFHRASLQNARLTSSHLRAPIFCGATLRRALCNEVTWGWPAGDSSQISDSDPSLHGATFINADLSLTNFDRSRLRAYFCGAQFTSASLVDADLSHSRFDGVETFCHNTFSGSRLIRTKFRAAQIHATRFRFADLRDADFSLTDIGAKCTWPETNAHP